MKYDHFTNFSMEEQEDITKQVSLTSPFALAERFFIQFMNHSVVVELQARKFAKAMKAPLIFTSASHSINVQKVFKVVLSKVFDLKCTVPMIERIGDPILQY